MHVIYDPTECCENHMAIGDIHSQESNDESDIGEKSLEQLENIGVGWLVGCNNVFKCNDKIH